MAFDTHLRDEAIARRQQLNEQRRQETLAKLWRWLDQYAAQYGMEGVYAFGSVTVPGRFAERSDVDVAIEEINPEFYFDVMGYLMTELERDVDLVELRKCHFAHRIREQGILWKLEN